MQRSRPGRRLAALGTSVLLAAMLAPTAQAAADTMRDRIPGHRGPDIHAGEPRGPAYVGAVADAMDGEAAALSAFTARHELGRIDPTEDGVASAERRTRAAIKALNSQDVDAARSVGGAQRAMTSAQLLASLGDHLDRRALDRVVVGKETPAWKCLAEAMYFEARGEGVDGQLAVAEVILNRVDSRQYPDTVCGVVGQGANSGRACQFSYNCDGLKNRIANRPVYDRIGKIAWLMLKGKPRTLTDDALYFHSTAVSPSWSRKYVRTAQIGRHIFYRPKVRLSAN